MAVGIYKIPNLPQRILSAFFTTAAAILQTEAEGATLQWFQTFFRLRRWMILLFFSLDLN